MKASASLKPSPRVSPSPCRVIVSSRPFGGRGRAVYDAIGLQDMTTDDTYYERGITFSTVSSRNTTWRAPTSS